MTTAIQKLEDGTIKLTITIPSDLVKKTWEDIVDQTVKGAKISGFRKGKAPKKLVIDQIDNQKVQEEVLKKLLPEAYIEAVKTNNIKPIINPQIHVEKLGTKEDGAPNEQDWQFTALTCEAPEIVLGKYKDEIKKITAKAKIIIPGKEPVQPNFDEVVRTLLENVKAVIPAILVNQEVDRMLSQLLDEVKSLGLTLEQYLSSTKKSAEELRLGYAQKAENDIKLEFALQKIADNENITVEEKEVEEAIQKAKDDTERKNLEANRYMLTSILRQQKVLDFIKSL